MLKMQNQAIGEKTEIDVIDVLDQTTKLREAITFLSTTTKGKEISAMFWMLEDQVNVIEGMLKVLCENGIDEERQQGRVAEDVPFD